MKKRVFAMLLAGCMAMAMIACGNETAEEPEKENVTEEGVTEETIDTSVIGTSKLTELGAYTGIEYPSVEAEASEEQVESAVQSFLNANPTKTPQEIVTETSFVNIDYEGKKDGVAFDGGTAKGQELSIENSGYIDGFAESIVGMKVGETKDCPMTFPENYHSPDLAGVDVVFTITVNDCWEESPAELTEEFAVDNGYESVDALYEEKRAEMQKSLDDFARATAEYRILEAVAENSTFELNEDEIALFVDNMKYQYEQEAAYYYGVDLETYVKESGMTMEEFEETCRENAIFTIKRPLICTAVFEAEGMEMTEEIYKEKAQEYVEYYGMDSLEALEEAYTKVTVQMQVEADMALDFMVDHAVKLEAGAEEAK